MLKYVSLIPIIAITACAEAPTSKNQTTELHKTKSYGAYMLVMGKNYEPQALAAYAQALPPIYARYGGEYVSFATEVDVAEGSYAYQSLIISGWPSDTAARQFWDSPEYAEARKLREGIGEFDVVIVPSLTAAQKK